MLLQLTMPFVQLLWTNMIMCANFKSIQVSSFVFEHSFWKKRTHYLKHLE